MTLHSDWPRLDYFLAEITDRLDINQYLEELIIVIFLFCILAAFKSLGSRRKLRCKLKRWRKLLKRLRKVLNAIAKALK